MTYKEQIKQELQQNKWENVEIGSNTDWWVDEHWKVCLKYNPTVCFYLCFLVDPHIEGHRKKGQGIVQIKASKELPKNRNDETSIISILDLSKGIYDEKLTIFLKEIEIFKK